jgi:ribosomal protein S27E
VPDALEDQLCEECQNSQVTVILSSGQALCTACAAIRFRIPTTDRAKLRAAIETRTSAGTHWPRNS